MSSEFYTPGYIEDIRVEMSNESDVERECVSYTRLLIDLCNSHEALRASRDSLVVAIEDAGEWIVSMSNEDENADILDRLYRAIHPEQEATP